MSMKNVRVHTSTVPFHATPWVIVNNLVNCLLVLNINYSATVTIRNTVRVLLYVFVCESFNDNWTTFNKLILTIVFKDAWNLIFRNIVSFTRILRPSYFPYDLLPFQLRWSVLNYLILKYYFMFLFFLT